MPFPDAYFDVVLTSGVIEHIGVNETLPPRYSVAPQIDQQEQRLAFTQELMRVLSPDGVVFIDCPNGSFPYDFWHGNQPGTPRHHSRDEKFLPTFAELQGLLKQSGASFVRAMSPWHRLQFKQASTHLHGKVLRQPATLLFMLMSVAAFQWLAASAINPFLVVMAAKDESRSACDSERVARSPRSLHP